VVIRAEMTTTSAHESSGDGTGPRPGVGRGPVGALRRTDAGSSTPARSGESSSSSVCAARAAACPWARVPPRAGCWERAGEDEGSEHGTASSGGRRPRRAGAWTVNGSSTPSAPH